MENVLENESMLELQVDASASESLENGSWWAKFIAIVYIIALVISAIGISYVMNLGGFEELDYRYGISGLQSMVWVIFVVVLVAVGGLIALLFGFANKTSRALRENDQQLLESGIGSLKIYFIISGVFAILMLILNLFALLAA